MAWGDRIRNFFNPGFETEEERAAREQREESDALWGGLLEQAPGAYDLAGYGLFGGQMPDEFFNQYLGSQGYTTVAGGQGTPAGGAGRSKPGGGGTGGGMYAGGPDQFFGSLSPEEQARLRSEAQAAYVQEQLANDPLWGLNVADESQLAGAQADQGSIRAQRDALRQMQGIYDAGGYTDSERAQLAMSQRDAAMGERSQRLAALESARARGMGGGGMELMGALAAQQGGANRASDWANQIAVAGQQRALQALQNSGQLAGQIRGQSFSEDSARRAAADAWNRYQTGLIQDRQQQLGSATQTAFGNRMDITAGATNQYNGSSAITAANEAANNDATRDMIGAAITGVATAFGGPAAGAAAGGVMGATGRTAAPGGAGTAAGASQYELPGFDFGRYGRNGGRTY